MVKDTFTKCLLPKRPLPKCPLPKRLDTTSQSLLQWAELHGREIYRQNKNVSCEVNNVLKICQQLFWIGHIPVQKIVEGLPKIEFIDTISMDMVLFGQFLLSPMQR